MLPEFTFSAGVADTSEGEHWDELLRMADQRLLAAKRQRPQPGAGRPAAGEQAPHDRRGEIVIFGLPWSSPQGALERCAYTYLREVNT